jgi:hypothetical protein
MRVIEKEQEGLVSLLGKDVWLWCMNYIYSGTLIGVSHHGAKLANPKVVYKAGDLNKTGFEKSESFMSEHHYVRLNAIESYGALDD